MSQDDVDGWVLIQPGVNVPINTPGVEYKFSNGQVTRDGMRAFEYSEQLIAYRIAPSAALSAMPQRLSPELIAQLNALASRLTAQGEYDAVDLIDTVVARVTAMPGRELLAEALEALTPFAAQTRASGPTEERNIRRARAAADKIRASLTQEKQT